MARVFSEIAFTKAVRDMQEQQGSARMYDQMLSPEAEKGDVVGAVEARFIGLRDGFYQATVSETGWPYVQFRGGPRGFLKVLDEKTLAYADYRGNRQYISDGNLSRDDRVALILVDYPNSARIKIFGRARLSNDPELVARLHDTSYRARPERAVVIEVEGFDWNCPQHLPVRLTLNELEPVLAPIRKELADLKAENALLKAKFEKR